MLFRSFYIIPVSKLNYMDKNNLPIDLRVGKYGEIQYRIITSHLPLFSITRWKYWGWHTIWVFTHRPTACRDYTDSLHWVPLYNIDNPDDILTYGDLHDYVERQNRKEEEKFFSINYI